MVRLGMRGAKGERRDYQGWSLEKEYCGKGGVKGAIRQTNMHVGGRYIFES